MRVGIVSYQKEKNLSGINKVTVGTLFAIINNYKDVDLKFIGNPFWIGMNNIPFIDMIIDSKGITNMNIVQNAYRFNVIHSHFRAFHVGSNMKCGRILTVHDVLPLSHPQLYSKSVGNWQSGIEYRKCINEVDDIIADSEYTKREIVNYFETNPEKISVVYCGLYPEELYRLEGRMPRIMAQNYGNYFFAVSGFRINKNLRGLVKAFKEFIIKYPDTEIKLVIAGESRNVLKQEILHDNEKDILKDRIIFIGHISEEELVWMYRNSLLVIYPSFCEGFGLPVLEAMKLGKAVITSNTTSLPEVGGDAVEYCDPYDIDSIVVAIEHVAFDKQYRESLEKKAVVQADKFSYEKAARETMEIYRKYE